MFQLLVKISDDRFTVGWSVVPGFNNHPASKTNMAVRNELRPDVRITKPFVITKTPKDKRLDNFREMDKRLKVFDTLLVLEKI